MQRSPDLDERLARIEERMATRDDVDELRALLDRRASPGLRWAGSALFSAALTVGFLALVLVFTR